MGVVTATATAEDIYIQDYLSYCFWAMAIGVLTGWEIIQEQEADREEHDLRQSLEDLEDISDIELDAENEIHIDPKDKAFIADLVAKVVLFCEELSGAPLFPYQKELALRIVESLVIGDGEEITALWSRQSGKTQSVSLVIAGCMVIFPKLAVIYPSLMEKFKDGLMVGVFAPVEEQAQTLFSRIVDWLTSDRAVEIMLDPEIDDAPTGKGKLIRLKKSKSLCRMQTANPRAKIESKSYHLIVIDECQEADDYTISKSIHPMGAFYNATIVKTGTPARVKGNFYKAIQRNKRRQTKRGIRQNHFEFNWRYCAKYNKNYASFIKKEKVRIGEDSDEFQLSYELRWLLDRGMFITEGRFAELGDVSMEISKAYWHSPVLVGIDVAKSVDSTVVTVVHVDWEHPDEFGLFPHRVLNWLELQGENWEEQYFQIVDFLAAYDVFAIGVDGQGLGDVVADRLQRLMPRVEVHAIESTVPAQSERWKHLTTLIERDMIVWPAHSRARRTKQWQRFSQQMTDCVKEFRGPNLLVAAPDEADAHDDYVDSLALACALTIDVSMPEIQESSNPFYR